MASESTSRGDGPATAGLGPGSRVAGYVIEEQIGAGGMAVVFRARDEVLSRPAAVKVLSPALAADAEFRARFLRESRWIAAVDEPHILPVYAAGEAGGVLYIATRFVAGGDLAGMLRRDSGPLAPQRAASLISQVAAALDAAHAIGLVHRDVKPGNILIDAVPGRPEHAYLSDFGISKAASSTTTLTAAGSFLGTPDYCAPEQIADSPLDGRADQYALGCVAFSLLTGSPPFSRADRLAILFAHAHEPVPAASAIRAGLPPAVDAVLTTALAKQPEGRYGSCGEFATALREALAPAAAGSAAVLNPGERPPLTEVVAPAQTPPGPASSAPPPSGPFAPGGTPVWDEPTMPVQTPGHGQAIVPDTPARPPGKPGRTRLIIAASAAVVLAAAVGIGVALSSSSGTSSAGGRGSGKPAAVRRAPHLAATLITPGGAEISSKTPVIMSEDGKYLAAEGVSARQSDIYVWDTATGKYVTTLSLPAGGEAWPEGFSAGDQTLTAFSFKDFTFYKLDLSTGKRTAIRALPSNGVEFDVSVDRNTLVTANLAGTTIDVTDLSSGANISQLKVPAKAAIAWNSLGLDKAGDEVIVSDKSGTGYVIQTHTDQVLTTVHFPYATSGSYPLLSPDGSTVLVPASTSGTQYKLWNIDYQSDITPQDPRWPTNGRFSFSSDGSVVLTIPPGTTYDLWNEATRAHIITVTIPNSQDYLTAGLGTDGRQLVVGPGASAGTAYTKLYVWDIPA